MKVVTANVPESYIEAIAKLTGNHGGNQLFPSRSELVRVAVREWLVKELKQIEKELKYNEELEDFDDENYVRVPTKRDAESEPVREFKTYKIVKRLEF